MRASRRNAAWVAVASLPLLGREPPGLPAAARAGLPAPALSRLAASVGSWRPARGRLCGFDGAAGAASTATGQPADVLAFAAAAAEITEAARQDASPAARHALGVLRIFEGRLDDAVATLRAAAGDLSAPACAWSDLAAAHEARSASREDAAELVLAFEAAVRAVEVDPPRLEVLFNHAFVLDRLALPSARAAWERYLAADESSPWSREARASLADWTVPAPAAQWAALKEILERTGRPPAGLPEDRIAEHAERARSWAMRGLLPGWADARLAGDAARAQWNLGLAEELGRVLSKTLSDDLLADAVRAARDLERRRGDEAVRQVEAHRRFGEAAALFATDRYGEADAAFARASGELGRADSPLAVVAELERARCDYYRGVGESAEARLREVGARAGTRWPTVRGHGLRLRGLLLFEQGRFADALRDYVAATDLLEAARESEWAIHARYLATEALRDLGQDQAAWRSRLEALRALRALGDPAARPAIFADMAEALLEEGRPGLARRAADEFIAASRTLGDAAILASALRLRARCSSRLGLPHDVFDDLVAARRAAETIAEPSLRRRVIADVGLAEAETRVAWDPGRALSILAEVDEAYRASGMAVMRAQVAGLRGRAYREMSRPQEAVRAFEESIAQLERQAAGIEDDRVRSGYRDRSDSSYRELMRIQAEAGDAHGALASAERTRVVALPPSEGRSGDAVLALESGLPPEAAVVEYAFAGERLLAWVIRRGGTRLVPLHATGTELAHTLAEAVDRIAAGTDDRAADAALARIHARTLEPLAAELAGTSRLLIVPDGELWQVPWWALPAAPDRRLGERWSLSLAPSAAKIAEVMGAAAAPPGPPTLVVVANPTFDRQAFSWLPVLSGASIEAERVAGLYPGAVVVAGAAATPSRVLTGLAQASVLHFAGHVIAGRHGSGSALVLAPEAQDTPLPPRSVLHDVDLGALDLGHLQLAVLSSCRGTAGTMTRRTGTASLARVLLDRGARSVVGALWDAEDEATAELMAAFHQRYAATRSAVCALRDAQSAMARGSGRARRGLAAWSGFQVLSASVGEERCDPLEGGPRAVAVHQ